MKYGRFFQPPPGWGLRNLNPTSLPTAIQLAIRQSKMAFSADYSGAVKTPKQDVLTGQIRLKDTGMACVYGDAHV